MYLSSGRGHLCSDCYVTLNFSAWHDLLWGLARSNSSKAVDSRLCIITERGDEKPFPSINSFWCCLLFKHQKRKRIELKFKRNLIQIFFAKLCFRNKYIINTFWFVTVAMPVHSPSRKYFIINVAMYDYEGIWNFITPLLYIIIDFLIFYSI